MAGNRYVVAGLANVRSPWFGEVGRWATSAAIPVDFIKCVSADELRARLSSGRSFSAVLVGATVAGLDRDLIDTVAQSGAALVVVDDGGARRDWTDLGAASVLPADFTRRDLTDELSRHGRPLERLTEHRVGRPEKLPASDWSGRLVAVTGGHGAGASTVAMSLAQGLADDPRFDDLTLLADLNLHADLALLHDARDIVPALQELVEAHRMGNPSPIEIRNMVFADTSRGYHLLLGLRRHRDWAVLRRRAVTASLASLRRSYRMVVADIEADVEGEDDVGSPDIEERNLLARSTVRYSDVVIAVGSPTVKGLHDLLRVLGDLVAFGVEPTRILPVLNRSPRSMRQRSEAAATFGALAAPISADFPSPLHLPERRHLDQVLRDNLRLPRQLSDPLGQAVSTIVDQYEPIAPDSEPEPLAVVPGSLGHFADSNEPNAGSSDAGGLDGFDFPESEAG